MDACFFFCKFRKGAALRRETYSLSMADFSVVRQPLTPDGAAVHFRFYRCLPTTYLLTEAAECFGLTRVSPRPLEYQRRFTIDIIRTTGHIVKCEPAISVCRRSIVMLCGENSMIFGPKKPGAFLLRVFPFHLCNSTILIQSFSLTTWRMTIH